jgi:phage terminase large subunit-like protein
VDFIETNLRFFKGPAAGQPFRLRPWQERVVRQLFGRLRPDGLRQYRTCYVEIPRKRGKSTFAGAIALYLLLGDGEEGPEVYCAAHDRAQAKIVYRSAKLMAQRSPTIDPRVMTFQVEMETVEGTGFMRAISADSGSQQGLDPHGMIVDELHVHRDRDLLDTLQTAMGARRQPITLIITTAGETGEGPCWTEHEYALGVLKGTIVDDSYLAVIYAAAPEDDWTLEATWLKANPDVERGCELEYLRRQCQKARESPAFQNAFRRYHLDQWVAQETRFLPMERWADCAGQVDEDQLAGQPCYGALDLSSTLDVTAWVLVFPRVDGVFVVVPKFFIPTAGLADRSRRDKVQYDRWAREGRIILCPGEVIDYHTVRAQIDEDRMRFDLRELAFDRWGAQEISQELSENGIVVVPFGQGYASMSAPTKALLALVMARKLAHGGHPVLSWMADCLVVAQDPAGNLKPVKPDRRKNSKRIDGMVALVMALDRAMRHSVSVVVAQKARSVYESRGIVVF